MNTKNISRRKLIQAAGGIAAGVTALNSLPAIAQDKGQRPSNTTRVQVLNPCHRVPVSLIIDDSTCLVNMAHFGIPQFAEAFPDQYRQDWRKLPREIPDSFVRKFIAWCDEHNVKGKYSIVPYPACVGWVDTRLPGWSRKQLADSLNLVRESITPNWDIHPEMVSHTFVINTKTGKPYEEISPRFMENWQWTDGKSVDELANYMSYALRILQRAGLECEGITTPGGFGNRVLNELSQATLQSCRDVFNAEIPHYFRHLFTDDTSVAPRVEYASGLESNDPRCVVSIIGCTGDWFGGWDGLEPGSTDRFITEDLQRGRMVDVIEKGEPAIIVCHWPGVYFNGEETGFNIFKEVVRRLHARYDNLIWMRLSQIARYWAAKELTRIEQTGSRITFHAPYACPQFTLRIPKTAQKPAQLTASNQIVPLNPVSTPLNLQSNTQCRENNNLLICFDLPKGVSILQV